MIYKSKEEKQMLKDYVKELKQKMRQERKHLSFPQRHPNLPLVISIIALLVAIVKDLI